MALIRKVRGHEPVIGENTFLAETAVILGDVTIGRDCSIWYNAVLRGDVNRIVIGDRTNIQDGVVLHTIYDKAKHPSQTIIGNDVSVGHNAIIHGAVIGDNCLIGMGATLLDNARIPSGCIIAANALVLSNAQLEPNSVYAGVPAKKGQGGDCGAARGDHPPHGPRLYAVRLLVRRAGRVTGFRAARQDAAGNRVRRPVPLRILPGRDPSRRRRRLRPPEAKSGNF